MRKESYCPSICIAQRSTSTRNLFESQDATDVRSFDTLQKHVERVSNAGTASKPIEPTTALKRKTLGALTVEQKRFQTPGIARYSDHHKENL